MSDSPVTLEFLGRQLPNIQAEQRRMRTDMDTLITLVVGQNDWNRRFEQRLSQFDQRLVDQTDILVAEFKGRTAIAQMQVERQQDELRDRVEVLETGKPRFTP